MPQKRSGYHNQAIVESIIELQSTASNPTLFIYDWSPSAVAIGTFQKIEDACNKEECKRLGIDIVRRMTGGGSVYIGEEESFTYSIIAPEEILPKDVSKSYKLICARIAKALKNLSIDAEHRTSNDIFIGQRKISGTVQTWRNSTVMVGGTIIMKADRTVMNRVLVYNREKLREKGITDPFDAVTSIEENSNCTKEDVIESIIKELTNNDFYIGDLTEEEINLANVLEKTKYRTKEWIFKR